MRKGQNNIRKTIKAIKYLTLKELYDFLKQLKKRNKITVVQKTIRICKQKTVVSDKEEDVNIKEITIDTTRYEKPD